METYNYDVEEIVCIWALVTDTDQVVGELLNGVGSLTRLYRLRIMGNENRLEGFHDADAFFPLRRNNLHEQTRGACG